MSDNVQHWELFGYDIRQVGGYWRAAWREFLWGAHSPVMERLDEPVRVHGSDAGQFFFAGKPIPDAGAREVNCEAVILLEEHVLQKTLSLPAAAEADLDAVMALEIAAHNPFPHGDTASGWTVTDRTDDRLSVGLAIASTSAVMSYLARQYDCQDPGAYEIWARVGSAFVVLRGFGESRRQGHYRQRLAKMAALLGLCALLVVGIAGTYAAARYLELQQYREISALVQREAGAATSARESLLVAGETVTAMNEYVTRYPNPQVELARLTRLLGDDASIVRFEMEGRELRLQGRARDGASVVQELTREPAYRKVSSPQAISKMGNSGYEEFHLDITLAGGVQP
jgi:hypothetical protein